MADSKVPQEYRVVYAIIDAGAPHLLLSKGLPDSDILEEHGSRTEIKR
jgi:hypothetical protein